MTQRASEEIRRQACERGIPFLAHFTSIENLPGILQYGLLPRAEAERRSIEVRVSDHSRLDENLEASSLSISDVNWDMFHAKKVRNPRAVWVVLLFDPSILWTHTCRFCFRNAAHKDLRNCRKYRGGPWGFATMFDGLPQPTGRHSHRGQDRPSSLPARADAEVQVFGRIAPELIRGAWLSARGYDGRVRDLLRNLPGGERTVRSD